ncbi:MAG: gallate dioxygenase, partial [Betaproteobacteria bacterium]|nr:gallate dioxygenase [Betaproteobacteria bacterium]
MATIIGGIGVSHSPTIGFAYDTGKQADPAWAPIFSGFEPVREWLKEKQPDALVYIFNDHVTSFFFDHYSPFVLGIDNAYAVADEGGGARTLPPVPGHPELAQHIGLSLVADEFDMSFFQDKPLDHGFFSPMSVLLEREGEHGERWPTTIVPLQVGVLQFSTPSAARCFK